MRKLWFNILMIAAFLLSGCDQDNVNPEHKFNCNDLATAIINNNSERVKEVVDQILQNYKPNNNKPEDKERFDALISRLEACSEIEITNNCFGCLYSIPPQSTIGLEVICNGQTTSKWLRLRHDSQNNLFFVEFN